MLCTLTLTPLERTKFEGTVKVMGRRPPRFVLPGVLTERMGQQYAQRRPQLSKPSSHHQADASGKKSIRKSNISERIPANANGGQAQEKVEKGGGALGERLYPPSADRATLHQEAPNSRQM